MDRSLDGGVDGAARRRGGARDGASGGGARDGASGGGPRERRRTERSGARRGAARRVFTAEDEARLRRLAAEIDVERARQREGTQGHLRLGRSLEEIRRRRLYLIDGCADFGQWAQARFGWEEANQARKYIRAARRVDPEAAAGYVLGINALDLLGRVARGDQAALLRSLGPEGAHIEERQLRKVVPRLPGKGRRANLQDCLRQLDRLLAKEEEILGRLRAQLGAEAAPRLAELGARQEAMRALLRRLGPAGAAAAEEPKGPGEQAPTAAEAAESDKADVFSGLLLPPAAPSRRAHAPLPAEAEERAPAPQLDLGCLSAVVDPQTLAALEREAQESRRAAQERAPVPAPAVVMAPGAEDVDAGEEYTPLAPPPGPPLVLPPCFEAAEAATPLLRTAAVAGDGDLSSVGLLGLRYKSWEPLCLSYAAPFAMGLFGVPGAGKSYALGAVVEGALQPLPALNHLRRPLCAVSLHYHPAASYEPELLAGVEGNGDETDGAVLTRVYGARPRGLRDVVALVLPEQVAAMRVRHPCLQVHPIRFALRELGTDGLRILLGLGVSEAAPHYARQVEALLRQMPEAPSWNALVRAVRAFPFDRRARGLLAERLWQVRPWIDDRHELRDFLRPGRLLQIDLRGDQVAGEQAMALFALCVRVLALSAPRRRGGEERPPLLLCYDEAHKFTRVALLRQQMETLVRERRHLGVSVVLSSQDPPSLPGEVLALLDQVGVFRHESAEWARHLGRANAAFARLPVKATAELPPGLLWYWARRWQVLREGWAEPEGPLLLAARPRASRHGG